MFDWDLSSHTIFTLLIFIPVAVTQAIYNGGLDIVNALGVFFVLWLLMIPILLIAKIGE